MTLNFKSRHGADMYNIKSYMKITHKLFLIFTHEKIVTEFVCKCLSLVERRDIADIIIRNRIYLFLQFKNTFLSYILIT